MMLVSGGFLGRGRGPFDHAHDVGLLHDQEFLAVDLDLGAAPLAEQDLVSGLDVQRDELAAFVAGARTSSDDLALLRLLLRGVRDDDAALRLFLAFEATDDDAVMQGTELHECFLFEIARTGRGFRNAGTQPWGVLTALR